MSEFTPQDPDYRARVFASFARQQAMATLGAALERVEPGIAEIVMPFSAHLTQQHGFIHAGMIAAALDSSCGYAAFTLMPADAAVLTIEFKTNLLAPAKGERFIFLGQVVKAGRTISVCEAQAFAADSGSRKLVATMSATMMTITGRDAVKG